VTEGPLVDATVVGGLFVVLLVAGGLLFSYRERSR
jgi:hypothetical protein